MPLAYKSALVLKAKIKTVALAGSVSGISQSMASLGNVNSAADAHKHVSTTTQTALNTTSDNAGPYTQSNVCSNISTLIGGAAEVLNALNELAAALSAVADYAQMAHNS